MGRADARQRELHPRRRGTWYCAHSLLRTCACVCVFRKLASCCFHFLALFLYSGCLGLWLYVPEPEQPLDEWGCGLTFLSEMMACT